MLYSNPLWVGTMTVCVVPFSCAGNAALQDPSCQDCWSGGQVRGDSVTIGVWIGAPFPEFVQSHLKLLISLEPLSLNSRLGVIGAL